MKKRKLSAHRNIRLLKMERKYKKWRQKQMWFPRIAADTHNFRRSIFGPRYRQRRKLYFYLKRKDKQLWTY